MRGRMRLRKARRQDEGESGRAVLRLPNCKVIVPDAVRAVIREEEERRVASHKPLEG